MATHPTTAEAIRDRMIEVIEGLEPLAIPGDRFRRYRNEGDGDFIDWAEANPNAARRRFQVRDDGEDEQPNIATNTDVEAREVTIVLLVAYPQTSRDGRDQALDRDDAMNADEHQLEQAVGSRSRPQFTYPFADCTWADTQSERIIGTSCDFLQMTLRYTFYRSMT